MQNTSSSDICPRSCKQCYAWIWSGILTYLADSLNGSTDAKREQGVKRRVLAAAAIPGNRQNFLCAAHPSNEGSSGGTCQEGSVLRWKWGQTLLPAPELPPPTNWGWSWTGEGQYTLYWTRLPEAAHSCIELVSCKCKKGCVRRCSCEKATLQCRALCDLRRGLHVTQRMSYKKSRSLNRMARSKF